MFLQVYNICTLLSIQLLYFFQKPLQIYYTRTTWEVQSQHWARSRGWKAMDCFAALATTGRHGVTLVLRLCEERSDVAIHYHVGTQLRTFKVVHV